MGDKIEFITDTEVKESGPAIDIRATENGHVTASVGELPLVHYGWWSLIHAREITGEPIEEVMVLARQFIRKIGQLGNLPPMRQVSIQVDPNTRNLVIKAAGPIEDKK